MQITPTHRAERLNCNQFSLFQLGLILVLDKRDGLAAVDLIVENIVGGEAADRFDWEGFASDLDFVAFHGFLDGGADVANADVDSSGL